MKKLLYITPRTEGSGGVAKFLSIRTKYLAEKYGYQVNILVTNAQTDAHFFDFGHVEISKKHIPGKGISYFYNYIKIVKAHLSATAPDIIIIVDNGLKGYLLPGFIKKPTNRVIFEQHGYRFYRELEFPNTVVNRLKNKLINFCTNLSMAKTDRITVLVPANKKEWKFTNIAVMPNPLPERFLNQGKPNYSGKTVIAVGRHAYEKGFDLLLAIWQKVVYDFPDWHLAIYGDKNDGMDLQKIVNELGLENQVSLYEPVENIREKYQQASFYLMTSRHEGFGNVLMEAMACGLPCIAFDCPTGPGFIINHEENGFLVPSFDHDQYAERIKELIANEDLRLQMGENAQKSTERFALDNIMQKWDELFSSLLE